MKAKKQTKTVEKKPEKESTQKASETKKIADDFEKTEAKKEITPKKKSVKKAAKIKGPKISLAENDPNVFQVILDGANIGSVRTYDFAKKVIPESNDCLSTISIAQDSHRGEVVILDDVVIGKLTRKAGLSITKKSGVEEILLDGKKIGVLTRDQKTTGGF